MSGVRALRHLRTGHIDLYQVPGGQLETAPDETLRALDLLVSSGKVRYIRASNYACWQLMKALGTATAWTCRALPASRSTTRCGDSAAGTALQLSRQNRRAPGGRAADHASLE